MRARLSMAAVLVVIAAAMAAAVDVFQDYGLDRQAWADSFVNSMTGQSLYAPSLPARLKSVAPDQRAAIVTALGTAAKAFFATQAFKDQYKAEYQAQLPDDLKPPRSAKEIADTMRAEMKKGLEDFEKSIKSMPPEMRAEMQKTYTEMKANVAEQSKMMDMLAEQQAAQEKASYTAAKNNPDPDALSPDPAVTLKRSLKQFLAETAAVDFAAQTKVQYGMKRFANETYEGKPKPWKMCYRAGREACDAARAFATSWLAELK